jgi:hypothetical protein
MSEPTPIEETEPEAPAPSSLNKGAEAESTEKAKKPLTKEEQMALYEKALKEEDWGHQPC